MVTIADVLKWKPAELHAAADLLSAHKKALVDLQQDIDYSTPPESWAAGAGNNARKHHEKLRLRLNDLVAEVADVMVTLDEMVDTIAAAQTDLHTALDDAQRNNFHVDHHDGRVWYQGSYANTEEAQAGAQTMAGIISEIDAALKRASHQDELLAKALNAAAQGKDEGGDGTLEDATAQLPPSLDGKTPAELAKLLGDGVAVDTISAYLNADLELASWKVDGAAEAKYETMLDGSVVMSLHLEGGLGRDIDTGGADLSVEGGATTDLELKFANAEEAKKFLDGLGDAALHFGWRDIGNPPAAVVKNVADYVMKQDIESFRAGAYVSGKADFDSPWLRADLSGRADAQYDFVKHEVDISLTADAHADVGADKHDPDAAATADATGKVVLDARDGSPKSFSLEGSLSGEVANRELGLDGGTTGVGADYSVEVSTDNPHWHDIQQAASDGDIDKAKELAYQYGKVTYRTYTTEDLGSSHHDIDVKVGKADVSYGVKDEHATQIWVKPEGQRQPIRISSEAY